jgi:hypothetical protein
MDDDSTLKPSAPPNNGSDRATPIADALARLGEDGEGFDATLTAAKDQKPAASVGGWWEWGKRNQFGAGGAVQIAKDAWAAIAKVRWRPGGNGS